MASSKSVVEILKFENPHQFWFRRKEDTDKLTLMEQNLSHIMANSRSLPLKATVGMKVCVKKDIYWKRAIVRNVFEREYQCWLIDDAEMLVCTRVYQMGLDVASKPNFAVEAGLNLLVPIEMRFDFKTSKQLPNLLTKWSQGSIVLTKKIIAQSSPLVFLREANILEVEFGQLLFSDNNGLPTSLSTELVEKHVAQINQAEFRKSFFEESGENSADNYDTFTMKTGITGLGFKGRNKAPSIPQSQPTGMRKSDISQWLRDTETKLTETSDVNVNVVTSTTSIRDSDDDSSNHNVTTDNIEIIPAALNPTFLQKVLAKNRLKDFSLNVNHDDVKSSVNTLDKKVSPQKSDTSPQSKTSDILNKSLSSSKSSECDWSLLDSVASKRNFTTSGIELTPAGASLSGTRKNNILASQGAIKKSSGSSNRSGRSNDSFGGPRQSRDNYGNQSGSSRRSFDKPVSCRDDNAKNRHSTGSRNFDKENRQYAAKSNDFDNCQPKNQHSRITRTHKSDSKLDDSDVSTKSDNSRQSGSSNRYYDIPTSVLKNKCRSDSSRLSNNDDTRNSDRVSNKSASSVDVTPQLKQNLDNTVSSKATDTSANDSQHSFAMTDDSNDRSQRREDTVDHTYFENKSSPSSSFSTAAAPPTAVITPPINDDVTAAAPEPAQTCTGTLNLQKHVCQCEKCALWNDSELGPEMNLVFIDEVQKNKKMVKETVEVEQKVIERPAQLFWIKEGEEPVEKRNISVKTIAVQTSLRAVGGRTKRAQIPPVLVHSLMLPLPTALVTDVPGFHQHILTSLAKHRYREAKPVQRYGWPAAMAGDHVVLVHGPATGKTLTHIPVVASFIVGGMVRASGREQYGREKEPAAIVLCDGSTTAEVVYALYRKLLIQDNAKCKLNIALAIPPLGKEFMDQFNRKVDILVTIPSVLCKLVATYIINVKNLHHLILEDCDVLLTRFKQEMAAIERLLTSMLNHRTFGYSVQLLITSEHWTQPLSSFVSRLKSVPLICIGAPMETALYGKANVKVHMMDSGVKAYNAYDIIKESFHLYKTIIVCANSSEILDLEDIFKHHGIAFVSATVDMEGREITDAELQWENTVSGDHKILLCDDHCLMNNFSIRNAQTLIHYSLPEQSWAMFTQRFRCLFDSYASPLVAEPTRVKCQIHIYIDDKCDRQLSKLLQCFKQMGAHLPDAFVEKVEKVHLQHETLKIQHATALCPHVKLFGECTKTACDKRHKLDFRLDRSNANYGHLPKDGPVKFRLLSVADATTYYVRLLEDKDVKKGQQARKNRKLTERNNDDVDREYTDLLVTMKYELNIQGNRVRAQHVKVGEKYILEESNNSLRRCQVTKIKETDRITKMATIVDAHMLDDGNTIQIVTDNLFVMPKSIKKIPLLAVEVHIANIIPPAGDPSFSYYIRNKVSSLLQEHSTVSSLKNASTIAVNKHDHYYTGTVCLQLGNTLWLDNVKMIRHLSQADVDLVSLVVKSEMVDRFWGEKSEVPMERLRKLCHASSLTVPKIAKLPKKKAIVREQVTPQWAFLEQDSWNKVTYSAGETLNCFYVNLHKFSKQLSDLHGHILRLLQRPFYPPLGDVTPGRYYLAPDNDQPDVDMCRVLVTAVTRAPDGSAKAECFYVDYGHYCAVPFAQMRHLRDDMINQLPFQAIECRLNGIQYPIPEDINIAAMDFVSVYTMEYDREFVRTWYVYSAEKRTDESPCNAVNFFCNNQQIDLSKVKSNIRRQTYSIFAYFEDNNEIVSFNSMIAESIQKLVVTDTEALLASENAENQLMDVIIQSRNGEDANDEIASTKSSISKYDKPNMSADQAFLKILGGDNKFIDSFDSDDDIQISSKAEFFKELAQTAHHRSSSPIPPHTKPPLLPAIEPSPPLPSTSNCSTSGFTSMVAVPAGNTDILTPEVHWHQTGGHLEMDIRIPAVVEYRAKLIMGNMFQFSTTVNGKKYELKLRLYKSLKSNFKHKALGLSVNLKFDKLNEEEWPRLLRTTTKQVHIKYDIAKIEPEYDSDDPDNPRKKSRKFLDLGPENADIPDIEEFWYNEDSDYNNSESDYGSDKAEDV